MSTTNFSTVSRYKVLHTNTIVYSYQTLRIPLSPTLFVFWSLPTKNSKRGPSEYNNLAAAAHCPKLSLANFERYDTTMQPLQPSRNDHLYQVQSDRRLLTKSSKSSRHFVAESSTEFKPTNRHHDNEDDKDRRSNRRSAMGRAKSMRHFRSSRKERPTSSVTPSFNQDEHDPEEKSKQKENEDQDMFADFDEMVKQRVKPRRAKSSDGAELLSSKSAHVSSSRRGWDDDSNKHGMASSSHHRRSGKRNSSRKDELSSSKSSHDVTSRASRKDVLSSSKSSHNAMSRASRKDALPSSKSSYDIMSRAKSMRNLNISKDRDMLSMSKSSHDPGVRGRGGRPAMARRSSLSGLLGGSSKSSKEEKASSVAPVAVQMSKPKATGPYEGISLIQCDVQVHGGAELAANNRGLVGRATSNPFIEVWQNLPTHMVGKTKTVHKTLAPTYDESFYLQWTEKALSRCLSKSHQAKIILKVWDADRISGKEAMGEVSVPVPLPGECPKVSKQWFLVDRDSARNASGRLQVSLNVMYVNSEED